MSVRLERSKRESAWGEKVEGIIKWDKKMLVHTNSDSEKREYINSERAKREKTCHLHDLFTHDIMVN